MKTLLAILSILAVILALPAQAGPKKPKAPADETPAYRIVEVDAVSIRVTIGKDGNTHEAFKITDATKVTLDGAPAFARDLKAGMTARITFGPDRTTAVAVDAKDPTAHPAKHRLG